MYVFYLGIVVFWCLIMSEGEGWRGRGRVGWVGRMWVGLGWFGLGGCGATRNSVGGFIKRTL